MRLLACADTETETDTDVNLPTACAPAPAPADRPGWARAYAQVREHTARLAAGLSAEDQALQSMPETSPTKWHLAHTTWFFEALLLLAHAPGYQAVNARWAALFNSYYESLGPRHPRPQRGLLSRPSLDEVRHYRRQVDEAVQRFIATAPEPTWLAAVDTLTLGLHHEQQHQELLLTDILHAFSLNPLQPAYAVVAPQARSATPTGAAGNRRNRAPARWVNVDAGLVQVGHPGDGFAFDNERPRHATWLAPHALASQLVSNAEYAEFIADGGYTQAALWLSDGWAQVQALGWQAPAYWHARMDEPSTQAASHGSDGFEQFSLQGRVPLDPLAPVCHLSGYEAAAYATWAGARLPTEFEWEHAAATQAQADASAVVGNGAGAGAGAGGNLNTNPAPLRQLFGQVWQWTRSAYAPYPGFRPLPGPAAEYNGKFMINQLVLRGSSLATPAGHARLSYRNFFPPGARWQFSGLRLARDQPA